MQPAVEATGTYSICARSCTPMIMPSVLWHCWLSIMNSIWPIKKLSDELLAWLSVWNEVQMICIWSSWCPCHLIISSFIKIKTGLTFLVPTYPGCPGKEAIKEMSCKPTIQHQLEMAQFDILYITSYQWSLATMPLSCNTSKMSSFV